jgi:hypothetical protein
MCKVAHPQQAKKHLALLGSLLHVDWSRDNGTTLSCSWHCSIQMSAETEK